MNQNTIRRLIHEIDFKNFHRRPILSNLFIGAGLYHSIFIEDSYLQVPIVLFFPSSYVGYNFYKNYPLIKSELKSILDKN